jgi:hypothetical protein
MKKLMVSTAAFALSVTLALSQNPKPVSSSTQHSWDIVITPQTTIHQLDSLMIKLKRENAFLGFSELEYNSNGNLMKIKGSVNIHTKDGLPSDTFTSDNLESFEIKFDAKTGVLSIKGQ